MMNVKGGVGVQIRTPSCFYAILVCAVDIICVVGVYVLETMSYMIHVANVLHVQ